MIVDTNVIFDLLSGDAKFGKVVAKAFSLLASQRTAIVNHIVFAEISPHFQSPELVRQELDSFGVRVAPITDAVAHRAGLAFAEYRRRGGRREAILPDFIIGAHAEVLRIAILTRDVKRFESYFPAVEVIDPMTVTDG